MNLPKDRGTDRIKKLEEYLAHPTSQQGEIDALNELAWELRMSQREKAHALCQRANELSSSIEYVSQPYVHGLADSLVNQAFMDTYEGKLDDAVSKCLQALALLQSSRSSTEIKGWFTLGWTSFFLSDYPNALENGLKALSLAREFGDKLHEAWALDAIASFHGITGDFETAVPLHEDALKIFRDLQDILGELRTLNNMAVSLHKMKQYERALEAGEQSLQLAKQLELDMDICNNSCTLADILISMDKLDEAEVCLRESVSSYMHGSSVAHVYVLKSVGYLRLLRNDLWGAEAYVVQALELAEKLDQQAEQAICYEALSEICEKQGQHAKALENYKKFHELQDAIQGEQTAKRLAVLKITHQVETARHAAEIYRLEALELQRKVDEQKIIQSVLEFQNTVDPLTELHNRRYFDEILLKEYSRHSRSGTELSLLMMDVDQFKGFNDTYGHVRGDECLRQVAKVIRNSIARPPDVAARYGGEEFICLLPETSLEGALIIAEHIRQGVTMLAIPHHGSSVAKFVTVSIGIVTAICVNGGVATELVMKADEQLYIAKAHGRNRAEATQIGQQTLE